MPLRLRPAFVTIAFVVGFAVIANLAWATAITTTGPWYAAAISLQVYATVWVVATLLVVALVVNGAMRISLLEASRVRIDREITVLRMRPGARAGTESSEGGYGSPAAFNLTAVLDGLAQADAPSLVHVEKEGHDALVPVPRTQARSDATAGSEIYRGLVRERIALREAQARVWPAAMGPILMGLAFLAIAGPMLPGSDGFATTHYQLNTASVLFLSYGMPLLVAWAVWSFRLGGTIARPTDG